MRRSLRLPLPAQGAANSHIQSMTSPNTPQEINEIKFFSKPYTLESDEFESELNQIGSKVDIHFFLSSDYQVR